MSLVFSPIYRPLKNPVCVFEIILSKTSFNLLAMQADASLYETFNKVIGLQFFKYCLGLLSLGRQVIRPCLCVIESCSFMKPTFSDLLMKCFMSSQKN